jgi:hypothetical protein
MPAGCSFDFANLFISRPRTICRRFRKVTNAVGCTVTHFVVIVEGEVNPAEGYLIDYGDMQRAAEPARRPANIASPPRQKRDSHGKNAAVSRT